MHIADSSLFKKVKSVCDLKLPKKVREKVGEFGCVTLYAVDPWPYDSDIIVVESPTYGKYVLIKLEEENG